MLITALPTTLKNSLLIPIVLFLTLSGGVANQINIISTSPIYPWLEPETVQVSPRSFTYRKDGEFTKDGVPSDAPLKTVFMTSAVEIMKYQVTADDYQRCVTAGVCLAAATPITEPNIPQTGVNYGDANAYAAWLSQMTGQTWRLPTDEELAFTAGSKFPDDALGIETNPNNPAIRWLADYEREAATKRTRTRRLMPPGYFGTNEFGLADFGGNIWEWTSTCHSKTKLSDGPRPESVEELCGVYVTAGPHRSPMSDFIRDPKGGGCSVGTPPDNLGFRLVKVDNWLTRISAWFHTTTPTR